MEDEMNVGGSQYLSSPPLGFGLGGPVGGGRVEGGILVATRSSRFGCGVSRVARTGAAKRGGWVGWGRKSKAKERVSDALRHSRSTGDKGRGRQTLVRSSRRRA